MVKIKLAVVFLNLTRLCRGVLKYLNGLSSGQEGVCGAKFKKLGKETEESSDKFFIVLKLCNHRNKPLRTEL